MELIYTHIDNSVESATMFLKGIIGKGGVDSVQFVSEIKYLEKLGIKNLEIRINSGGGSVIAGYDIVDAMLSTPINTTTFIAGMAASMAGVIAMTGKQIKIANYGILMIHSVSGMKNDEVIGKFNHSLIAIFNSRTNIDKSYLERLMNTETFFTAEEAHKAGFVDEIVVTKRQITEDVRNTSLEELLNIYNKIDIEKMEDNTELEVVNTEEVQAQPEVAVEQVAEAENPEPDKVEEPENADEPEKEEGDELANKNAELVKINEDLMKQIADLQTAKNELEEKEANRLKAESDAANLAVINAALEAGKITEEVKDTWMNFISLDFEGTKKALDKIVVNKTSPDILASVNILKAKVHQKSLRELEIENPQEVERIYNQAPEIYKQMYFEQYGNYPAL